MSTKRIERKIKKKLGVKQGVKQKSGGHDPPRSPFRIGTASGVLDKERTFVSDPDENYLKIPRSSTLGEF